MGVIKKLLYISVLLAFSVLLTLSSCSGGEEPEPSAELEVNVKGVQGNIHQNAEVRLFSSLQDWFNKTNQVGDVVLTNSEGKALFTGLESKKYYWLVEKSCLSNIFSFSTTTNPIELGKRSVVSTFIEGTGTLKLVNTSNDIYKVFIDGEIADGSLEGGEERDFIAKEGSLEVRVLQETGFSSTPLDETYIATIDCGKNTTVSFP